MLTKKVKIYGGYLHILGMVHDCKWLAEIISRSFKHTVCMFNFLGEVGKLTIVAGCFNVLHHQRPTGLAAISANRAT